MHRSLYPATSLVVLLSGLCAQDKTDKAAEAAAPSKLDKAMAATAAAGSIAFKTTETQDSAMTRQFAGMMGGQDREVSGKCAGGLLYASFNDEDDEIVTSGARTLARSGGGGWKLRRGFTVGGQALPFVLDPLLLLETLRSLPESARKTVHEDKTKLDGKELEVLTVTLDGELARDLTLGGAMPKVQGMGGIVFAGGGPPGMQAPPAPDVTVDLAFFVDPETSLIHRIRMKGYEEGGMPGNVMIRMGGPGGADVGEEEEEQEEAKDEKQDAGKADKLVFKVGLPVRKLTKKISAVEFDVRLSEHGKASLPELKPEVRKQLGK